MLLPTLLCSALISKTAALVVDPGDNDYFSHDGGYYPEVSSLWISEFVLFTSCWTLLFVLYLFFTSTSAYTRTDRPIGRFFNQKLVFVFDSLTAVFWFASFVALALHYQALGSCHYVGASVCGSILTGVFVGVCTWYDWFSISSLKMSNDKSAGLLSSQRQSWLRAIRFVLAVRFPRRRLGGGSTSSRGSVLQAEYCHGSTHLPKYPHGQNTR